MRQTDPFLRDGGGAARPSSTAQIVVFPVASRARLIRQTAALLHKRKTTEGRRSAWWRALEKLKAEMADHGADQATIDRHLCDFHRAVSNELAAGHDHQQPPGAA